MHTCAYLQPAQHLCINIALILKAHVRGHQVRKSYKKIIWSVGFLDKVILRWKRKGRGLSSFKTETHLEGPSMQATSSKEDDYDFLKEGRKQTEERLQKALARVKSMVQYPEARDQYRRLLNVVSEMQETKVFNDLNLSMHHIYHMCVSIIDLAITCTMCRYPIENYSLEGDNLDIPDADG